MPALIAHAYVALTVLEKIEDQVVLQAIHNHKNLFLLSSMGPDVYYYYGLLKNGNSVVKVGKIIHKQKPAMTFDLLREEIFSARNDLERECAIAILAGFLCHYGLDRVGHPYVYYLQSMLQKRVHSHATHAKVEAHLDAWILHNCFVSAEQDFHKIIFYISNQEHAAYCQILARLGRKVSNRKITPSQISEGIRSMRRVLKFFYSRSYIIMLFSSVCQKMSFKWTEGADFFIPKQPDGCIDYLNMGKKEWFNVSNPKIKNHESLPEILENACDDGLWLIKNMCNFKDQNISALKVTKNISFDSGLKVD